jgi:hypothetical protein
MMVDLVEISKVGKLVSECQEQLRQLATVNEITKLNSQPLISIKEFKRVVFYTLNKLLSF